MRQSSEVEQLWVRLDLLRHPCGTCIDLFNHGESARADRRCSACGMGLKDRLARAKKEGLHADQ